MNKGKKMKHIWKTLALAAIVVTGCAKENSSNSTNELAREYLEAWIAVHYPDAQKTADGIYLLEDTPGTGAAWNGELAYTLADYTIRALSGTISSSTSADIAKQLGTYSVANFYGPKVIITGESASYAGVDAMLSGMKVGGTRSAIIPSWLMTTSRYDTEADYFKHESTTAAAIYTIHLTGQFEDLTRWEKDSLAAYVERHFPGTESATFSEDIEAEDSGFYFITDYVPDEDAVAFPNDTTLKLNYIGRLLNGQVFDTSIADTAKFYGIYNASRTYEPVSITFSSTYSDITMDDNSPITGFQGALFLMEDPHQKATTLFISDYGYTSSGSGNTIPPYSPLRFDLELVGND